MSKSPSNTAPKNSNSPSANSSGSNSSGPNPTLAEETVGLFRDFVGELGPLSRRLGEQVESGNREINMDPLIDGLELVNESISQLNLALGMQGAELSHKVALERELITLMTDLVDSIRHEDPAAKADILKNKLPEHLSSWRSIGLK